MSATEHSGDGAPPARPWVDPDLFIRVEHPSSNEDWHELLREHVAADRDAPDDPRSVDPKAKRPLEQIFAIVKKRCRTVLVEYRYVDPDYRSEFARFWARTFRERSPFARRLHFFEAVIEKHQLHDLPVPGDAGYLGYTVVRPVPNGPVGRTVIVPPEEFNRVDATLVLIRDSVQIAGREYEVRGAPFAQQDGQLLRCAHVAAWMCHYSAYRRGFVGRQLTASFIDAAPPSLSYDRLLPSHGMNSLQIQATFAAFNVPAVLYDLDQLPEVGGVTNPKVPVNKVNKYDEPEPGGMWDTRIFSIVCRYLNSGFPVMVGTGTEHAFTLIGWYRDGDAIRFIANDDVDGPYKTIPSPFTDKPERLPWKMLMVPLPPNAFVEAEAAENFAFDTFVRYASLGVEHWAKLFGDEIAKRLVELGRRVKDDELKLRTAFRENRDYKARIGDRGFDDPLVRMVRLAHLPHYSWVVEVHEPKNCAVPEEPCVVAELVIDSTSDSDRPESSLAIFPGVAWTVPPEGVSPRATLAVPLRWESALATCGTFTTPKQPSNPSREPVKK
jgi:hypothetical protein